MKEIYVSLWDKNKVWTKTVRKNITVLLEWFGYSNSLISIFNKPEDVDTKDNLLFVYYKKWIWKWLRKITKQDLEETIIVNSLYKKYLGLKNIIYSSIITDKNKAAMVYGNFHQLVWDVDLDDHFFEDVIYDWYKCLFSWLVHDEDWTICVNLMLKKDWNFFIVKDIEKIKFLNI